MTPYSQVSLLIIIFLINYKTNLILLILTLKAYKLYSDTQNKAFGTLISNSDIDSTLEVHKPYRLC